MATDKNNEPKKFSNEVKKHFLEIVSTYTKYQDMMDRKSDLAEVAEVLGGITEAARELAANEAEDWFDKHTVKRNMSELDKLGKQFDKVAIEAKALDQRLGGLYEDMGHILSRYYKLGDITEDTMKARLGMNESNSPAMKTVKSLKPGQSIIINKPGIKGDAINVPVTFVKYNWFPQWAQVTYNNKMYRVSLTPMTDTKPITIELTNESKDLTLSEAIKSIQEGVVNDFEVIAQKSVNFKIFTKAIYNTIESLPKDVNTLKWLKGIYMDARMNMKMESITESRRIDDFFDEKHGAAILKILGGREFKANKVKDYLDALLDRLGDIKGIRVLEQLGKQLGIDYKKYDDKPLSKYEFVLLHAIEEAYHSYRKERTESITEGGMSELDTMAQEAKDFKAFAKEAIKEFPNLKHDSGTLKWLKELYDEAKTDESIVNENNLADTFKVGDRVKITNKSKHKLLRGKPGKVAYVNSKKGIVGIDFGKEQEDSGKYVSFNLDGILKTDTGLYFYDKGWLSSKLDPSFDLRYVIKLNNEVVNEDTYTNQTGVKSALMKVPEFINLVSTKTQKWIRHSDVKIFFDGRFAIFTDGKREMVSTKSSPFKILKSLSNASVETKKQYKLVSESINEATHGYETSTGGYMGDHKNEFKLATQLNKKAGKNEVKFYDELETLHEKLGHPKYMLWLSGALRGYKVDMYKDPKIKNQQEAEEALFLLSK